MQKIFVFLSFCDPSLLCFLGLFVGSELVVLKAFFSRNYALGVCGNGWGGATAHFLDSLHVHQVKFSLILPDLYSDVQIYRLLVLHQNRYSPVIIPPYLIQKLSLVDFNFPTHHSIQLPYFCSFLFFSLSPLYYTNTLASSYFVPPNHNRRYRIFCSSISGIMSFLITSCMNREKVSSWRITHK